jgi:Spy/CpxP family protein refolding chaperone
MKTTILKSFMLAIGGLFLSTSLLLAQPERERQQGPPPVPNEEQIQKMVGDLSAELSLSARQTKEVKALFTDHFKQVAQKQVAKKNNREKNREEMEKLRSTFENQVASILSTEQKKKFIEFQKNHIPGKKGRPENRN